MSALSKSYAILFKIAGRIEFLIFMVGSAWLPKRNLAVLELNDIPLSKFSIASVFSLRYYFSAAAES